MEHKEWNEQKKWDEEKWPPRRDSVYQELFGRKEERDVRAITEEDINQMARDATIREGGGGVGVGVPGRAFNFECNRDNLRHLAQGNGDINPLFYDEEYAKNTRWGGIIAPPAFIHCTGTGAVPEGPPEETRRRTTNPLRGIQALYSGDDCYYFRPIRPGDFIWRSMRGSEAEIKRSQFSGQTIFTRNLTAIANQKGELLCVRKMLVIWSGRQTQTDEKGYGERKKYSHIKKQYYTPEDIKRIEADMDREEVRGSDPRYWEDVNEGDELPPVVKGPLSIIDMVNFDIGHGMTMYDGSHHIAYNYRKRHPAAWPVNEYGIPDTVESVHWVDKLGRQVTNVGAYDYGEQRYAWLCNVVTNWMGDDAWLYHIDGEWRKFVYAGDTNWVRGKVTRKYRDDFGQYKVDLEIYCQDQRGDITAPGHATVILPSKVGGLPQVPPLDTPAPFKPEQVETLIGKEPVWRNQLTS